MKVYKISVESPYPVIQPVNLFLLAGNDLILIDSGDGTSYSMKKLSDGLERLGFDLSDISMIINTHEHIEHFGGNAAIKEVSGAEILAHRLAIPFIEDMRNQVTPENELKDLPVEVSQFVKIRSEMYKDLKTARVDTGLEDNAIPVGDFILRIIHTPGHARGHICIYEEEEGTLFTGDLITGKGTPYVGALPSQYGDMADFLDSLRRIKDLRIRRLLPSHGEELKDPYKRIEETMQSKLRRERKVLQVLDKGKSLSEIVDLTYEERVLPYFAYGEVLAYLEKLMNEGRVKKNERYELVVKSN